MAQRLTINYDKKPCYDIVFTQAFDELAAEIEALGFKERKIAILTDSHVAPLYAEEIESCLKPLAKQVDTFTFPAGEKNKNLATVKDAYTFLIEKKYDRHDLLIALGGGVVGDLTGFVAATYLRGVAFIQIPTTTIAQSDSSIGGKTGVDFDGYKNMIGAFYMPKLVYMNVSTLKTLDDRQYYNGFGEIMKHGIIKSAVFYEWLLENMYEIHDRNPEVLEEMIIQSCTIKKLVVEKDPMEKGDRALLNFGHTIGHAIEKAMNFELLHGECVALGAVAAAYISWKREWLSMEEYYEIRDMFVPFNLPISIDNIDPEQIESITRSDKKADGDKIRFVLLKKLGKAVIATDVTKQEILDAINEIYYREEEDNE